MKKLDFMDVGFLLAETHQTPMHVGGVSLYTLPEGANEQSFLQVFAETLRDVQDFQPPFGDKLKTGPLGLAGSAYWEKDQSLDIDYHIRHSALPKPGRYRELFNLVSRLHATLLDRNRPLWEMHLIEGLQNRQFAIYQKTHHAAVDGARSIHLARSMLSNDPDFRMTESPLSRVAGDRYKASLGIDQARSYSDEEIRNVSERLREHFDTGASLFGAVRRATQVWRGKGGSLMMPFVDVPRSSINTSVDGARRFVAARLTMQSWPCALVPCATI
jgi:WS/DGAT/MGAT family acyltransferase